MAARADEMDSRVVRPDSRISLASEADWARYFWRVMFEKFVLQFAMSMKV